MKIFKDFAVAGKQVHKLFANGKRVKTLLVGGKEVKMADPITF